MRRYSVSLPRARGEADSFPADGILEAGLQPKVHCPAIKIQHPSPMALTMPGVFPSQRRGVIMKAVIMAGDKKSTSAFNLIFPSPWCQ